MIEDGVVPSSILLFTFTKKAANEIKDRVISVIGTAAGQVTVSTYHSFCCKVLRQYHDAVELNKNFTILDDDDKNAVISHVLRKGELGEEAEQWDIDASVFNDRISKLKENYVFPDEAVNNAERDGDKLNLLIAKVYKEYQRKVRESNSVDFDDLIMYVTWILENKPIIKEELQKRYKYIVADEVQDSGVLDIRFISNLVNDIDKNICMVGDINQSIYAFRGAVPQSVLEYAKSVGCQNFFLERNYRSTQNIVDAANSLIQVNPQANEFNAFSRNEVGGKILHITCKNPAQQAIKVSAMINSLIKTTADNDEPIKYGDIAILYRTSFLSRQIEEVLLQYHIPYMIVNGLSFYDRMEIKDLMAYIRFIINPQDDMALRRILNVPKRKLGDVAIKNISEYLVQCFRDCGIMDTAHVVSKLREYGKGEGKKFKIGIDSFCNAVNDVLSFIEECNEPGRIMEKLIATINYKNYLEAYDKETWSDRYGNVCELINIANGNMNLLDFMESMTMDRSEDPNNRDVVKLMTVHGSKGLEFRVVFVVACNESLFPHFRCSDTEEGVQEERRLMYVAMTRAKKHLILSDMKEMRMFGQHKPLSPSRFLKQIDKQYLIEKAFC